MATISREIRLLRRPVGMPTTDDFEAVSCDVPPPRAGEVQVRNLWMGVDPAMRGRMYDVKSYVPPFELGAPLEGPAIGEVLTSNEPTFAPGDVVYSRCGWREVFNAPASALKKRDCTVLSPSDYLGFAGMTGLTAFAGLFDVAEARKGDVVFVSAASGGVGSTVCQFAKIKGCTVIGSAGGPKKTAFLRDTLAIDAAIDYKAEPSLKKALGRAAPDGIDVYFDNVGGDHLEAALAIAKPFARFALCGMISQYNATEPVTAPRNLTQAVVKSLRLQGFIAFNYLDREDAFLREVVEWRKAGLIAPYETVYEGIDRALEAFFGLFSGDNLGRAMVRLS